MNAFRFFAGLFLVLASMPLRAVTWNVTSTADVDVPGTLRHAVANYAANDTIKFDAALAGQTISLTGGELPLIHNVTLIGPGPTNLAIVNNLDRVFHTSGAGINITISGLKLTGHHKGTRGTDGFLGNVNGTAGADAQGGGILNDAHCTVAVSNCFFTGCQAIGGDGGNAYTNDLYGSTANGGNGGKSCGGAICNASGDVLLTDCTFAGNFAISGHGGNGSYGGNGGNGGGDGGAFGGGAQGGALCDAYGNSDVFIVNCTFYGNTAAAGDGGDAGDAWIFGAGNGGNGGAGGAAEGGAIFFGSGCPTIDCTGIVHCTIDNNQVAPGEGKKGGQGIGGGVIGANGANGAAHGGGLYAPPTPYLPVNNTIVAGDYATFHFTTGSMVFQGPDVFHNVTNSHNNFIGKLDGTSLGWVAALDFTGTPTAPLDPLLGPLQLNGGETPTQAPGPCSPVIDMGSATLFNRDQILQLRPKGITPSPYFADGSDIGAFELQSFPTNTPPLAINYNYPTNLVTISWPAAFCCFTLQQNTNLASTNWVAVTSPVIPAGGQCLTVVTNSRPHQFFRLAHP